MSPAEIVALIVVVAISGLVAGAVARLVLPGRQRLSILATMGYGVLGSFLAGIVLGIVTAPFGPARRPRPLLGFVASVAGAGLVIWLAERRRPKA